MVVGAAARHGSKRDARGSPTALRGHTDREPAVEQRCEQDDRDARAFFEAEISALMDRLYGAALRLTRNGPDAEDLVAESVAKAWEALPQLRDRRIFAKWMLRILTNTFVSDWRRKRGRPVIEPRDTVTEETPGEEFSLFRRLHQPFLLWWGTPEHALLNKLLRHDLERAFDGVPEPYRVVMVMVELEGWSYAETAEALELPIGTVRSRLARARSHLQRALWKQGKEAGLIAADAPAPVGRRS
jgi:RNA polymerase sigma-70 factor, ECF subfamily